MNNRGRVVEAALETPGLDLLADGPDELRTFVREEIARGVETIEIVRASAGHGVPGRTHAQHGARSSSPRS